MRARLRGPLTVLAAILAAGCATAAADPDPDQADDVSPGMLALTIEVTNQGASPSDLTLFVQPQVGGVSRQVGVVAAGQTSTFNIEVSRGSHQLVAQMSSGNRTSSSFNVLDHGRVTWNLSTGTVNYTRRR